MNTYRRSVFIGIITVLLSIIFFTAGNAWADDFYEENDTLETAWPVEYNWVRRWLSDINGFGIQADDDWYRMDVNPASERIQIDCRFTDADGDIDMELYDSDGNPLTISETTTDNEFIDYPISSGGTYYIRVYSIFGNTGNTYDLRWDDLTDDAYEENNARATAWYPEYNWERTWLSDIDGFGIQFDEDWYQIDVDPGSERIRVDCRFTHTEGDIDIGLYDSTETLLAESNTTTDNEFIDYTDSVSGTYYIRVYKGNAGNMYDLWWDDLPEDAYEENDTLGTAWHPGFNWERTWLSDIGGLGIQADDDWYRIYVDAASERIQVDCQFTHAEGDIDIELYDSTGDLVPTLGGGSVTDNELIDHPIVGGGTYYIKVLLSNVGNAYDLRWDDFSTGSPALISGLGEASGGWMETFAEDYSHADWLRVGWPPYNSANGEARIATGDIDGDGRDEIVLGLGPVSGDPNYPGGWFEVLDDDYSHLAWGRVNWPPYNSANGETRPACGDVDGDGRDEIVIGLGQGGDGWIEVFDDVSSGHAHLAWPRVQWGPYNSANGETRPACGDLDADGKDEIVVGLGPVSGDPNYPGGWFEVLDNDYSHLDWGRVKWSPYNSANGETWPMVKE